MCVGNAGELSRMMTDAPNETDHVIYTTSLVQSTVIR